MSFILDALKKSDSERQRQAGPALFEVRSAAPRSGLPAWALALGALLAVNIVGLGWFLLRSPAPASRDNTSTVAPAAAQPAPSSPARARGSAAAHTDAPGAATSAVPAPAVPAPIVAAPVLPPTPAAATPAIAPGEESTNPADYEEALPAQQSLRPAHAAGSVEIASGIAPTEEELPPAIRNQLPELRLDMHVYAARAADRFVFINMQRLREGEATRDGIRVDEITPTGAILSFRGTRFRLERD